MNLGGDQKLLDLIDRLQGSPDFRELVARLGSHHEKQLMDLVNTPVDDVQVAQGMARQMLMLLKLFSKK